MNKGYAPIIITTLHRYDHFVRCIESLKRNRLAQFTDIYIGIDYPPDTKYEKGNKKIIYYVDHMEGFKNVHVLKHSKNLGSELNFFSLRDLVYKEYDKYISIEDDNEVSPCFLEFMNCALDKYENDESVLAVSGYMYPISDGGDHFSNEVIRINTYFAATAFGFWKNKEQMMREMINMQQFHKYYYDTIGMKQLYRNSKNQYCNFVKGMLKYIPELIKDDELAQLDLSFGIYLYFENMSMIYPIISKVRNWGYDGTGEHCDKIDADEKGFRGYDFSLQEIDENESFFENIKEVHCDKIDSLLEEFFKIGPDELIKTKVAYRLSKIVGIKLSRKIISKYRKS